MLHFRSTIRLVVDVLVPASDVEQAGDGREGQRTSAAGGGRAQMSVVGDEGDADASTTLAATHVQVTTGVDEPLDIRREDLHRRAATPRMH